MENQELLLLELEEFDRSNQIDKPISQNLVNFIEYVAKTGTHVFPWNKIKKLYLSKLTQSIEAFYQNANLDQVSSPNNANILCNEIKDRILDRMKSFYNAPFTIQRISELLLKPQCNYTRLDKFLRGIEKCVMVVTTIDPQGNKIFTESIMNGSGSIMNDNSVFNGVFYQKSFSSLQIETTLLETTVIPDKIKLIKQSKVDLENDTEIEATKLSEIKTEENGEKVSLEQVNEKNEEINSKNDEKMKTSGSENENSDEAMDN